MRNQGARPVRHAQTACSGKAAGRARESRKYSKRQVYQDKPTSGMALNSLSIDSQEPGWRAKNRPQEPGGM